MSSSSLDEVRTTTGTSLVRGSAGIRCTTSMPSSLGSLRSRRTTAGIVRGSRPACLPVPNRKSTASWPSLATTTLLAILAFRSARSVSSSSFALSSTSMIVFSISTPRRRAPSVEFRGGRLERADRQKLCHRLGVNRGGKEIPLGLITAVHAQKFQLLHGLDSLRDHPHPERMRERDHRLRDRRVVPVFVGLAYERAVDLQAVDRQPREIAQARIARAEVVHGDLHAQPFQTSEDGDRPVAALDQHAFGELELEIVRFELRRAQGALDGMHETGTAELLRRDVHCKPERSEPGLAPHPDLPAALREREFSERMDQNGVLRDGDELAGGDPSAPQVVPAHQRFDSNDAPTD